CLDAVVADDVLLVRTAEKPHIAEVSGPRELRARSHEIEVRDHSPVDGEIIHRLFAYRPGDTGGVRLHQGLRLRRYRHPLLQAGGLEMQIQRTQFPPPRLDVPYGPVTEARRGHHDVIRSGQETADEVESPFVCHALAHSLGLRIEDTHDHPADDGAGGIVSHAADSASIRLRFEKTWRLEKTYQDK